MLILQFDCQQITPKALSVSKMLATIKITSVVLWQSIVQRASPVIEITFPIVDYYSWSNFRFIKFVLFCILNILLQLQNYYQIINLLKIILKNKSKRTVKIKRTTGNIVWVTCTKLSFFTNIFLKWSFANNHRIFNVSNRTQ